MGQKSSIDRLPEKARKEIADLYRKGCTLDQILAKVIELHQAGELGPQVAEISRSALGRHTKKLAAITADMKRSRQMAEAVLEQFGQDDGQAARANIEMMHSVLFKTITNDGGDGTGPGFMTLDPEEVMMLSRALQSLSSADKLTTERVMKLQKAARDALAAEQAEALDESAKALGLTAKTVEDIKKQILFGEG